MKKESKGVCLHHCISAEPLGLCCRRTDLSATQCARFKFRCGEILPDIAITGFHPRDARARLKPRTIGGAAQLHRFPESHQFIHSWSLLYLNDERS